ncbi:MAG TPA: hypothetical protein VMG98_02870 [Verrucomicrobiae bacterium]|nr:hypothetical protein [Verrucomicrobiae bacterium]
MIQAVKGKAERPAPEKASGETGPKLVPLLLPPVQEQRSEIVFADAVGKYFVRKPISLSVQNRKTVAAVVWTELGIEAVGANLGEALDAFSERLAREVAHGNAAVLEYLGS